MNYIDSIHDESLTPSLALIKDGELQKRCEELWSKYEDKCDFVSGFIPNANATLQLIKNNKDYADRYYTP